MLVVSSAQVSFKLELELEQCGEPGVYGAAQRSWYLTERGLQYNATSGHLADKEPKAGFQLFTVLRPGEGEVEEWEGSGVTEGDTTNPACASTFHFSRVDNVEEFSTNFFLQGRSWYTKWVTVTNLVRFNWRLDFYNNWF